jgi:hypothetical protein
MIISGGVNIYPAEIEGVLVTMPNVRDCAVFGIPDEEFGEAVCAYIQPQDGAEPTEEEIRSYLRQHLAGYKVPKLIKFVASLPREDSGKIFKRKLRAPYWENAGRQIQDQPGSPLRRAGVRRCSFDTFQYYNRRRVGAGGGCGSGAVAGFKNHLACRNACGCSSGPLAWQHRGTLPSLSASKLGYPSDGGGR